MVVLYILLFILILGLVICIHEAGHFYFAKKAGILVNEFAFGMGPRLVSKKKGETVWSIRAFPIGGFCAMSGEEQTKPFINPGDKVKIEFNKDNKISKIVLDINNNKYKELIEVEVQKIDLFGKDMTPLYLNEYEIARDAVIVFIKNEEIQIAPEERNFFSKTVWQRLLVCIGGPLNNILLSLILFIILGFIVGVANTSTNVIGSVSENSPAMLAGIVEGDKVTKIGEYTINAFTDISSAIYGTNSAEIEFTIERDGESKTILVTPTYYFQNMGFSINKDMIMTTETEAALGGTNKTKAKQYGLIDNGDKFIGLIYNENTFYFNNPDELMNYVFINMKDGGSVRVIYERDSHVYTSETYDIYSEELLKSQSTSLVIKQVGISSETSHKFIPSLLAGLLYFKEGALTIFTSLKLLFTSKEVGIKDMGGFITILNQTANAASSGIESLIYWIALLSINLGIVNLLPIPALDGGRILLLLIEGVTKKKLNPKVETIIINACFFLLMGLIIYILFQDVFRMIIQLKCIF